MNGTLINYYFHCKRQCYLHGNHLELEDNSEDVKIGRAIHEEKANKRNDAEIAIDGIKVDKLGPEYLIEIKKSDADEEAGKWQLLYYLWILKGKGIIRKGKLEFVEKNKKGAKTTVYELTSANEKALEEKVRQVEELINQQDVPSVVFKKHCHRCAYYEYCFV
ncbi:MAG: CRISPR-associated protein Cas4 [Anaerovoracaceae bacterium]